MDLRKLLQDVKDGSTNIDDALSSLKNLPYEDIGYANIDHHREIRIGYPEVIYCEGKSDEHILGIIERMMEKGSNILGTRCRRETFEKIKRVYSNSEYEEISKIMVNKTNIFYLGRLVDYYLAMEGSLKLKEISYIHSEAFQAGELKHGSISLIDKDFGVIAVVTDKEISEKTISNLKEVESRGANIVTITNIKDDDFSKYKILLDDYNEVLNPLMAIIPMQLLAYNIAKLKGCDIDKPRNLAKSVTVE